MIHGPIRYDVAANTHEVVTFVWSTEHGYCYDCGCPAAFWAPNRYGKVELNPSDETKLCAVCAASEAVNGEQILRLEELG